MYIIKKNSIKISLNKLNLFKKKYIYLNLDIFEKTLNFLLKLIIKELKPLNK
jgi:hypothetical protein